MKAGDVRVSTGKCFIFVMKYIKLTYIQAGMMLISFLCVCLYLIHGGGTKEASEERWRTALRLAPQGWKEWVKRGNICCFFVFFLQP